MGTLLRHAYISYAAILIGNIVTVLDAGERIILEPMEVTATADRIHRTGDVVLEETPSFVTIIPRDRFKSRLTNLAEVIENETGVQIRQAGGLGSFSTVSLRGTSSQQVMVYLDGLPLNEASGGGVDLSQISLADVDAIEIYRGTTPINFARASIGGAINIRTLRATGKRQLYSKAGLGSLGTRQIGASYLEGKSHWEAVASANYFTTDNDFEFVNDRGTEFNPNDDRIETRHNAQVEQTNALIKLGRSVAPESKIDLLLNVFSKEQGLPSADNNPAATASLDTLNLNSTLRFTADQIRHSPWNMTARAFAIRRREDFDDSQSQIGLSAQNTRDTTWRYGAQVYAERVSLTNTLSGILDVSRETYNSEDLTRRRVDQDAERDVLESAIQSTWLPFDERLLLTPALRLQAHWDDFGDLGGTRSKTYLSPQAGLKYQLTDALTFKSNVGRYVRLPSFFELFGDRGFVIGNDALKAEEGVNFDIGIDYSKRYPMRWLRDLHFTINYFYSDIDDLIALVFDARGVGRALNISSAEIQGVELSTRFELPTDTYLTVNATTQDPLNRSGISAFNDKRLPGRYENMVFARVEQFIKQFKLYYEFRFESGLFFDAANLLPAKDVRMHNVGASADFGRWKFSFEANNLLDENFEEFNGFPTPGLTLRGTAAYRLGL